MTPAETPGATISLAAILAESARRRPEHPALLFEGERISYSRLWDETRAIAGALHALGVEPGNSVAMMFPNVPDFVRVYYAILSLGAVVVPIHPLLVAAEIEHVLTTSGAALLVVDESAPEHPRRAADAAGCRMIVSGTSEDGLDRLAARAAPIDAFRGMHPMAPAAMLFTSGTSGRAKGALLSHFSLLEQTHVALIDTFDVRPADVMGAALPLSHVFGQSNVLNTAFRRGATVALIRRFSAPHTLAELTATGCTVFAGVPTMLIALLENALERTPGKPSALPNLRYVISGGASLPHAAMDAFTQTFECPVHEGYGLSETSPTATLNHIGVEPRVGTVGTPLWGVDVRIAEPGADNISPLPAGSIGEVVIRGHGLFLGYQGEPEATSASYTDGWFRTGDLGRLDDDGYLTIVDRTKDLVIRGGYNIYPREVEEVLARMPGVRSVAVFGVPDDRLGQDVVAAVVGDSMTVDDVLAYAEEHIARHKRPRAAVLLDALPLGPSGKVLKRELARAWQLANPE